MAMYQSLTKFFFSKNCLISFTDFDKLLWDEKKEIRITNALTMSRIFSPFVIKIWPHPQTPSSKPFVRLFSEDYLEIFDPLPTNPLLSRCRNLWMGIQDSREDSPTVSLFLEKRKINFPSLLLLLIGYLVMQFLDVTFQLNYKTETTFETTITKSDLFQ